MHVKGVWEPKLIETSEPESLVDAQAYVFQGSHGQMVSHLDAFVAEIIRNLLAPISKVWPNRALNRGTTQRALDITISLVNQMLS